MREKTAAARFELGLFGAAYAISPLLLPASNGRRLMSKRKWPLGQQHKLNSEEKSICFRRDREI